MIETKYSPAERPTLDQTELERLRRIESSITASFLSPFERAMAHILLFRGESIPEGKHTFTEIGFKSVEELERACLEVDRVLSDYIKRSKKRINITKHMLGIGIFKRKLDKDREQTQLEIEGIGAHEFAHAKKAIGLGADVKEMRLRFTALTDGGENLDVSMSISLGTKDHKILAFSALAPKKPSPPDFETVRIVLGNQEKYPLSVDEISALKAEYTAKGGGAI